MMNFDISAGGVLFFGILVGFVVYLFLKPEGAPTEKRSMSLLASIKVGFGFAIGFALASLFMFLTSLIFFGFALKNFHSDMMF